MAGVMDSVNQRTQLVGQNRLELLLFRLDGKQLYGINVFKVREVLQCPKLTIMPKSSPVVCGVANIRGATIPILDLALATGSPALQDRQNPFVIITLAPIAGSRPRRARVIGINTPINAAKSRLRVMAAVITTPRDQLPYSK